MCGVFGVVLPIDAGAAGGAAGAAAATEAAVVAATGLFALQHRGQESAGLAVSDGDQLMLYKDLGLIGSVLDERRLPSLRGHLAIAHCRYSTTGSTVWENAQPTYRLGPRRAIAIGHNGNLVNTRELLGQLEGGRARLPASTDTELLTALLADEPAADTVDALLTVLPRVRGAYSLVILDEQRVIGVRDPYGFRPLVLGRLDLDRGEAPDDPDSLLAGLWPADDGRTAWILSSETTGLDIVGAEYVRDVEPGELVVLEPGRPPRSVRFADAHHALCVFELIYFARPDSYMEGRNLYEARRRMGMQLAREEPAEADLVMPVPDTGAAAAAGYAEAIGLPYREGMVRNRYTGRTFIQPSQAMRQRGVNVKLSPLREVVRDQRLILVDDSIVRGTTTKQIVSLLRRAGAAEVHVRISAPPIYHPCFYGIDTQVETELIAATTPIEGIREFIGADSLGYLSIKGVLTALDLPYERFCFACFDGNYPVPVPYDAHDRKFLLETGDLGSSDRGPAGASSPSSEGESRDDVEVVSASGLAG
jgi:amidophosphoribosyltransferase